LGRRMTSKQQKVHIRPQRNKYWLFII
jgi:hypothetical protein